MSIRRLITLTICCAAVASTAQTPTPEPLQIPADPPRVERALPVFRQVAADQALRIAGNGNVTGTNGELVLEPPSTGVVLRAFGSTTPIAFETNGAERMRIFESGKVSIGTTASNGQLNVFSSELAGRAFTVLHESVFTSGPTTLNMAAHIQGHTNVAAGATMNGNTTGS